MATTPSCLPDMAPSEGDGELDMLIKNFEFENQQYVKLVEKEKQQIAAQEQQIEEHKTEICRLQESTSHLDEDTKRYHRQFTQNRDNCDSLKKTSLVLSEHEEALQKKLSHLIVKGKEERCEQQGILEHYHKIWCEYQTQYESFPLAKKLAEKQKEKRSLEDRIAVSRAQVEELKTAVNKAKNVTVGGFIPYTELSSFVLKLAQTRAETKKCELQIEKLSSEISSTKSSIKDVEERKSRMKEEERKRIEEEKRKQQEEERDRIEQAEATRQEEERKKAQQIAEENNAGTEGQVDPINSQKSAQLPTSLCEPSVEVQTSKQWSAHHTAPQRQSADYLAPRLQIPQIHTPNLTQRSIRPQYPYYRNPRSPGQALRLPARIPVRSPNIQPNSQVPISAVPRMFRPPQIGVPARSASPVISAAGVQNVRSLIQPASPRCYPPAVTSQHGSRGISTENLSARAMVYPRPSPVGPRHITDLGVQLGRLETPSVHSTVSETVEGEVTQDPCTPGRSKSSMSAQSPASSMGSPFDLEKHLTVIQQLSCKSPGFTFSSRPMFDGNVDASIGADVNQPAAARLGESPFMQPFFGGGGGDCAEQFAPPTSGKDLFTTEMGSDKTTEFGPTSTHTSMAAMFGDAPSTTTANQSSNFFSSSSANHQNKAPFHFGGGDAEPQGGTMFAMFGQCEKSPPGNDGGFSFSFGGGAASPKDPSTSAAFSLF